MNAVLDLTSGMDPLRDLSARYLDTVGRSDRASREFGIYLVSSRSQYSPLCRFVEREVFMARFGNDDPQMDHEYNQYEESSFFVLAMDHRNLEPAGVMRVIRPSQLGWKTIRDIALDPGWGVTLDHIREWCPSIDLNGLWDIATLAVRRGWTASDRGTLISAGLYHSAYVASLMANCSHWIFALDENVAELLRACEVPLRRVCDLPAISYLGSPATAPYLIDMREVAEVARVAGPQFRQLVHGDGLETQLSLPPIDLRSEESLELTALEPQGTPS